MSTGSCTFPDVKASGAGGTINAAKHVDECQPASHFSKSARLLTSSAVMSAVLVLRLREVGIDHDLDQLAELHLRLPAEETLRLGVVADEQVHLGGALVAGVEFHELLPVQPDAREGDLAEFADGVGLVGREDVVVG